MRFAGDPAPPPKWSSNGFVSCGAASAKLDWALNFRRLQRLKTDTTEHNLRSRVPSGGSRAKPKLHIPLSAEQLWCSRAENSRKTARPVHARRCRCASKNVLASGARVHRTLKEGPCGDAESLAQRVFRFAVGMIPEMMILPVISVIICKSSRPTLT